MQEYLPLFHRDKGQSLSPSIKAGEPVDLNLLFTPEEQRRLSETFRRKGSESLAIVREELGGAFDYDRLRIFRAAFETQQPSSMRGTRL